MNENLTEIRPNRPDLIGFWPDSPSKQSKYADAIHRVVASLTALHIPVSPKDVRGKRRQKPKPHEASNTARTYLKGVELFSFWMQGKYGYELDPKDVTRQIAFEFLTWLMSDQPPNVLQIKTREAGGEISVVFQAMQKAEAVSPNGEFNIQQIYEQLPRSSASLYDPMKGGFDTLHHLVGNMIKSFRSIERIPSLKQLRLSKGTMASKEEKDPLTYRYRLKERTVYKPATATTYISVLSTIWDAMTEGENTEGGEAPLRYNPWKGQRGPLIVAQSKKKEAKRRTLDQVISNPIIDALLEATVGTDFEARRNRAAITMLIYTGMRAEELVGALRKDLVSIDGVLAVQVFGKGDKYRVLPIYAELRDALAQLDAKLQEISQRQSEDPDVQWTAAYATTLLQSQNAPIIPALPRWGANARNVDPTLAATETLDTSGLRAILTKLSDRARVYDNAKRTVRPLNSEERALVHPHALRHYAATAAQEAGLPMEGVKRMLGHEDISTTELYVHIPARSMAQYGAYIARARKGAAMTPEEAAKLQATKKSALEDKSIIAAPAYDPKRRAAATTPRPREQQAEREQTPQEQAKLDQPIASPYFAYQKGAEPLDSYLPTGYKAESLPKGQGFRLTFRLGRLSKLPWWAGRANQWPFEKLAPIVSFFQMFETDSTSIKPELEKMWLEVLDFLGVTAASAFAEWVAEILGYASAVFFNTMNARRDEDGDPEEWIEFDFSVRPSDMVVRMHPKEKILEWFQKNATAAEASVVRTPASWMTWQGTVAVVGVKRLGEPSQFDYVQEKYVDDKSAPSILAEQPTKIFESVLRVKKLPGFDEYFKPKLKEGRDVDIFKPGTGKGSKRVRFRILGGPWQHGIVVDIRTDERDRSQAFVVIQGERVPDNIERLDASRDQTKTEKVKRTRDEFYPKLADIKALPVWFFVDDPILDLPEEERLRLKDWLDKLQGKKLSKVRVISSASLLYQMMLSWKAATFAAREEELRTLSDKDRAQRVTVVRVIADDIKKKSNELFGVEVDPLAIVGMTGRAWKTQAKKTNPEAFTMMAPELDAKLEKRLQEAGTTLEQVVSWAKALPPGEKTIFAYVQMKLGWNIPITSWGLKAQPPIIKDTMGLFSGINLEWQGGTIVHNQATKLDFLQKYGTDSECVVRRMVRNLWERKKLHEFEYQIKDPTRPAPSIHRDVMHRHVNALMAYLIPCPSKMEEQLKVTLKILKDQRIMPISFEGMADVFDESMLGQIKGQPMVLREWWLRVKGEEEAETPLGMVIQMAGEMPEVYQGEKPGTAKPNAANFVRAMPNMVSLVFAEYWPV